MRNSKGDTIFQENLKKGLIFIGILLGGIALIILEMIMKNIGQALWTGTCS